MAKSPKEGKLIYHLTSMDNLENIFIHGLQSRKSITEFVDIADKDIINHREEKGLNNLIPFHFMAPSPLHGAVIKTNKEKRFAYITIHRDFAKKNNFKILKQHPLSLDNCSPVDYNDGISQINWDSMEKRNYNDHECKEICLAECLADTTIQAKDFFSIIVSCEDDKKYVEELRNRTIGKAGTFYINVQNYNFA